MSNYNNIQNEKLKSRKKKIENILNSKKYQNNDNDKEYHDELLNISDNSFVPINSNPKYNSNQMKNSKNINKSDIEKLKSLNIS